MILKFFALHNLKFLMLRKLTCFWEQRDTFLLCTKCFEDL
jgi:hypothetical protein